MIGHGTVPRFKDLWEQGGHLPIRELSVSPTVHPLTVNIRLILEPGLEFTFDYELSAQLFARGISLAPVRGNSEGDDTRMTDTDLRAADAIIARCPDYQVYRSQTNDHYLEVTPLNAAHLNKEDMETLHQALGQLKGIAQMLLDDNKRLRVIIENRPPGISLKAGADIRAGEAIYFDTQSQAQPTPLPNEPEIRRQAQEAGLDPDGAVYWLRRLGDARLLGPAIIHDEEKPERTDMEFSGLVLPETDGILSPGDHRVGTVLDNGQIEFHQSALTNRIKQQQEQIATLVDICLHHGTVVRLEGYEYTPEQERTANRIQGIVNDKETPDANDS